MTTFKKGNRVIVTKQAYDGYGDIGWTGTITNLGTQPHMVFVTYDEAHVNPRYSTMQVTCGWILCENLRRHLNIQIRNKPISIARQVIFQNNKYHEETLWKELIG